MTDQNTSRTYPHQRILDNNVQPLVSVVMATYNGERFIVEQIESILQQTHQNLEIIIQDDGSTDNTVTILKDYAAQDARIQINQNQTNLGINKNFYDLINKATGDYISISDQDDIWDIQKIEILVDKIGSNSLVYTDSQLIDQDGQSIGPTLLEELQHKPQSGKLLTTLFTHNTISGHSCLFSKALKAPLAQLVKSPQNLPGIYDQLIGTLASFRKGVAFVDRPLTLHRIHAHNNCNQFQQRNENHLATAYHSKRNKTKQRPPFFERKQKRVRIKIHSAWQKIAFFRQLFDLYAENGENPFHKASYSKRTFENSFINRKLYKYLTQAGINEYEAKLMSRGRYYYLILCYL